MELKPVISVSSVNLIPYLPHTPETRTVTHPWLRERQRHAHTEQRKRGRESQFMWVRY